MGVWARVRNASHMGADVNHLWPLMLYAAPGPTTPAATGTAVVVLARTSDPPCFSVMDIPIVQPSFSLAGTSRGSYLMKVGVVRVSVSVSVWGGVRGTIHCNEHTQPTEEPDAEHMV